MNKAGRERGRGREVEKGLRLQASAKPGTTDGVLSVIGKHSPHKSRAGAQGEKLLKPKTYTYFTIEC